MAWDLILWLLTFFIIISLLAVTVYQFVCLADLEIDHINIYDSSARINACVIPEFLIQGTLSVIFLLTWHWFMFLLSVPVSYYHIRLLTILLSSKLYIMYSMCLYHFTVYKRKKYMARKHLVDVTEIFTSLDRDKKYLLVKLGFYLIIFVIVIYRLVETSVTMAMHEEEDYRIH